ncbi:hypothetical protein KP509_26G030100 [Ceratopteris richardii]|uniref:Cyclin N-terminal domain-containing protein n=3 Tax=Ceratopteris richardii TaxID=49495 RepID=A0A8T2RJL5_CERRI|nr:hypothetical protein KP509_26G030100 [Ceratopteris richardii]KAH7296598.1 hypothetical protein KP509_26G030100 [Ceratopteris richardii]KAH7296599.1 hypothetical protein KP509_26G030100 [Ceratopteris richardii]KAH7296600.1 hypothetical protein KP509_26G030100 [Ceratopteris richardii]
MAGLDGEIQTRRLRGREIPVLRPLTRAAALASNSGLIDNSRRTKASTKRAAADDAGSRAASNVPSQHAKKRAALANLTNQSNSASTRHIGSTSKSCVSAASGKTRASNCHAREVQQAQLLPPKVTEIQDEVVQIPNTGRSSLGDSSITFENDENVHPDNGSVSDSLSSQDSKILQPSGNENKTVASLERKTQNSLYISKGCNSRARQGAIFEDYTEEGGWSTKNYLDIDNHKDPQMCSAYATEIYDHFRMAELKRRPAVDYMEAVQHDINANMRGILVDWLVEVAEEYKLVPDTLYLTISYIDRYLSGNLVSRQRLQLLGVACMLIASKYEEICAPHVEEFCYITDNTYNREEVLEMERSVLNHLHFELTGPTTKSFLRRFVRAAQAEQKSPTFQLEFLGNYLAELTLLEYGFLRFLPSMIAGAAVFVARLTLNPAQKPWNSTLQHYSGYKASELRECANAILELQKNTKNCTLPAIREKYRQHKFKCVAALVPPAAIAPEYFIDIE